MNKPQKISVLTSLYDCETFLRNYFEALSEINGKEQIEVLLLHNAPTDNELNIVNEYLPSMEFVRHIVIPERENLYCSWNRGIELSQGEYITVWNVDDVRFPKSILHQAEALDKTPQAAMVYGDIWISNQYGVQGSIRTYAPLYNYKKEFWKSYHASCFQMWRKSIHSGLGYYDEQFKCSADFDFQIRVALHYPLVKVEELLGIYLEDQPHKLSANGLQELENNIIYLRYGVYEKVNFFTTRLSLKKYNRSSLLFFGQWHALQARTPFSFLSRTGGVCCGIVQSVWKQMKTIVKKLLIKNKTC